MSRMMVHMITTLINPERRDPITCAVIERKREHMDLLARELHRRPQRLETEALSFR